jgi:hypothetical protein
MTDEKKIVEAKAMLDNMGLDYFCYVVEKDGANSQFIGSIKVGDMAAALLQILDTNDTVRRIVHAALIASDGERICPKPE